MEVVQELLGAFNIGVQDLVEDCFVDVGMGDFDDDAAPVATTGAEIFGWGDAHGAADIIPGIPASEFGGFTLGTNLDRNDFAIFFQVIQYLFDFFHDGIV